MNLEPVVVRQKANWKSRVRSHLLLWPAIYAVYLVLLFCGQRKLIFPGVHIRVEATPPAKAGMEVWSFSTPDGKVEAFFLPSVGAPNGTRTPALVFAHGNAEVIDGWVDGFGRLQALGFSVLLVEYPGYGRSAGTPSSESIGRIVAAAYDRLAADPRVAPDHIIGIGESLGGGAICALAQARPLKALILDSTFPSLSMFAARYLAPAFLMRDHFDNESALKSFAGPVLVMHGRDDRMVPWKKAQQMASTSPKATFKLYDCGHVCWFSAPEIGRDVEAFLSEESVGVAEGPWGIRRNMGSR